MMKEIVKCGKNPNYFINNYKRDKKRSLYEININGFGAELAFCRLCDVEFDSSTDSRENHFNNADAILKDGRTVDVKNTNYSYGKLLVRMGKEKKIVDIYALVIGTFPVFKFAGWASYADIIKPETIKDLGTGDSYCLTQNQLRKSLSIN